jgi:hypothetical protein
MRNLFRGLAMKIERSIKSTRLKSSSVLSVALAGLTGLSIGCNGDVYDCASEFSSMMHTNAEHHVRLVSSDIVEDEIAANIEEQAVQNETVDTENSPQAVSEPSAQAQSEAPVESTAAVVSAEPTATTEPKDEGEPSNIAESKVSEPEQTASPTDSVAQTETPEKLAGELNSKNFEDPSTLDEPTKVLPKGSPDWTTAGDKLTGGTHVLVANTAHCNTYQDSLDKLPGFAFAKFVRYANETLGIDVAEFKSITPEWVTRRLINGKDSEFVAEGMQGDSQTFTAWAKLEIDEATRNELEGMNRRLQLYWRPFRVGGVMLSAIALFGLTHVGFNVISSMQSKKNKRM